MNSAERRKETKRLWREANRDKEAEYSRNYKKRNAQKITERRLQQLYGITSEQYDVLFASQDCRCAICSTSTPSSKLGFMVDHDHSSGLVRGILCHQCNTLLGMSKDNPDTLRVAASYLERSHEARSNQTH